MNYYVLATRYPSQGHEFLNLTLCCGNDISTRILRMIIRQGRARARISLENPLDVTRADGTSARDDGGSVGRLCIATRFCTE